MFLIKSYFLTFFWVGVNNNIKIAVKKLIKIHNYTYLSQRSFKNEVKFVEEVQKKPLKIALRLNILLNMYNYTFYRRS